jgi:hypothetical protein
VAPSTRRNLATLAPLGLFLAAILIGFVGLAVDARPLVAVAAICVALSAGLFVLIPMFEMTRGRRR